MTKCSVFIATSLDGFIARTDGSIDWLNKANSLIPKGEDLGYQQFMSSVDAIVMGRNTFEQVLSFGDWPYGNMPVVVLSRQLDSFLENMPPNASLTDENPTTLVQRLSNQGLNHLYIDGGLTVQSFIAAGLIDEITITIIPILLGEGKPLFGSLPADMELELVESKAFEFGFVQNKYRSIRR
jgi:dihydrofolate reductase